MHARTQARRQAGRQGDFHLCVPDKRPRERELRKVCVVVRPVHFVGFHPSLSAIARTGRRADPKILESWISREAEKREAEEGGNKL